MSKISLSANTIRVRKKYQEDYLPLDTVFGQKDFLSFLNDYFNNVSEKVENDPHAKRVTIVDSPKIRGIKRTIAGVIRTGDYGYQTELLHIRKKTVDYTRSPEHSELKPFYFLINIPKGKDKGIVLLQRNGNDGISTIFQHSLNKFLKDKDQDLVIEFPKLVPKEIIDNYLDQGVIHSFKFIKFSLPSDETDYFNKGRLEEKAGKMELKISVSDDGIFTRTFLNRTIGRRKNENPQPIEVFGIEYDNVEVEVSLDKERKKIKIERNDLFRPYYDISDAIHYENGNPTFNSINRQAEELLKHLNNLLYPDLDLN